jgi:predicted nucleic-acid-binding Zn-ribbon protein
MPHLDEDQQQRARQWLRDKHALAACPGCDRNAWFIGDIVVAPTMINGTVPNDRHGSPMLQVVCERCSYITFYAAAPMGLLV